MLVENGIFTVYLTFAKPLQFLLPLVDLINVLLVYTQKIHFRERYSAMTSDHVPFRFLLTLVFCIVRLIIGLHMVRQKSFFKAHRRILLLLDLVLYLLLTVSLLRYTAWGVIRLGRKIIIGVLLFRSIPCDDDEQFGVRLIEWNASVRRLWTREHRAEATNLSAEQFETNAQLIYRSMLHRIFIIRNMLSALIISFFTIQVLCPAVSNAEYDWPFTWYKSMFLKCFLPMALGCVLIGRILHADLSKNRKDFQIADYPTISNVTAASVAGRSHVARLGNTKALKRCHV